MLPEIAPVRAWGSTNHEIEYTIALQTRIPRKPAAVLGVGEAPVLLPQTYTIGHDDVIQLHVVLPWLGLSGTHLRPNHTK